MPDFEKIKARLEAYWKPEALGRCCVSITAPKENRKKRMPLPEPITEKDWERWFTDEELLFEMAERNQEDTAFFGESMPVFFPNFGTAGQAKYAPGCSWVYQPNTIWFRPGISHWSEYQTAFDPQSPVYRREVTTIRRAAERFKGRIQVGFTDNCGILDSLAHVRGTDALLMDLLDEPEEVECALGLAIEGFKQSAGPLFDAAAPANDGGSAHAWMHTWSPGRHAQLQCDFSVMISAAQYERFVLPELSALTQWLDNSIYHLDGKEQLRHLDLLLSLPRLNAIQWTHVAGQEPTSYFIPELQKIQAAGKGLVLIPDISEADTLMENLKPDGLMLVFSTSTEKEAKALFEHIERHYGILPSGNS